MFIQDSDFYPSRISDPWSKNSNKRRGGGGELVFHTFFCSHKFHKVENYYIFWNAEEKNLGQFSKNYRSFLPKILSLSSQKYGFGIRDLGFKIQDQEKTYFGSRIQGSKRHWIPDWQHCCSLLLSLCALTTPCHFFLSFVLSLWSVTVCLSVPLVSLCSTCQREKV